MTANAVPTRRGLARLGLSALASLSLGAASAADSVAAF